jgi:hypothetical protein
MVFEIHPGKKLTELYKNKSYQGQLPEKAKYIFLGKDANWKADIEHQFYFPKIEEYLKDGVAFWKKYKIHHPFLLPEYRGDGKRFHTQFGKTYDGDCVAEQVSFIELIKFPTTGIARESKEKEAFEGLLFSDENMEHLKYIDRIISDKDKIVFIAWGLTKYIDEIRLRKGIFKSIPTDKSDMDINTLNRKGNLYFLRHFSDAISDATLQKVKAVLQPKKKYEENVRSERKEVREYQAETISEPVKTDEDFRTFDLIPLIKQNWFVRLFTSANKKNVIIEIKNFLLFHKVESLCEDFVKEMCKKHNISPDKCKDQFLKFFHNYGEENTPISDFEHIGRVLNIASETERDIRLIKIYRDPPVVGVSIALKPGELCHFKCSANWYEIGVISRKYYYSGFRTSMRILKLGGVGGSYYRFGSLKLDSISRRGWKKKDSGEVYYTNKRIILVGNEKTTSVNHTQLVEIGLQHDGVICKWQNRKNLFIRTYNPGFLEPSAINKYGNIYENGDINAIELSILISKNLPI